MSTFAMGNRPIPLTLAGLVLGALIVGPVWLLSSCSERESVPPEAPPPSPSTALFSFTDGTLPWPNDSASLPGYEDAYSAAQPSPAYQEYLTTYAHDLPGTTVQPLVRFLVDRRPQDLAIETFGNAVLLMEIRQGPDDTVELHTGPAIKMNPDEWAAGADKIWTRFTGVPSTPLLYNASYLVVLRSTATSAEGHPVTAAAGFSRVIHGPDEHDPAGEDIDPIDAEEEAFINAASAELTPLLQRLEDQGVDGQKIPRNEVALAWRFHVHNLPMAECDPRSPSTPTPNALQRNEDGTLKATYRSSPVSEADEVYLDWVYSRDGPSVREKPELLFSMALPEEFITDQHVQVFELGDTWSEPEAWTPFNVSTTSTPPDSVIRLEPQGDPLRGHRGFNPGTHYLAVVTAPLAANLVAPSDAIAILRLESSLVIDGRSQLPHLTDQSAAILESHRQDFGALFQGLEHHDIARRDVVALWTWRTRSDVELLFDSEAALPFPNDHLIQQPPLEENIGSPPGEHGEEILRLNNAFMERNGFATTAPIHVAFTGSVDAQSLDVADDHQNLSNMSKAGFLVFDVTGVTSPSQFSQNLCPTKADACAPPSPIQATVRQPGLIALGQKDGVPFPPGKRLLFVATNRLQVEDNTSRVGMDPRFRLLTIEHPLFDPVSQASLINELSSEEAAFLETRRLETNMFMGFINVATQGVIQAEDVVALWTLTTADPTETMRAAMAWVKEDPELNTPPQSFEITSAQSLESALDTIEFEFIAGGVLDGHFLSRARNEAPDEPRSTESAGQDSSDLSNWSVVERNFVMSLPNTAPPPGGWPVVIYLHDLAGDRLDLFALADTYGEIGRAGIATDSFQSETAGDELDREHLLRSEDGESSRQNVLQSLVNLSALVRFIREALPTQVAVNPEEIYVHAESGGGIIATPFLALETNVRGGVFSFFGGNLARIATENTVSNSWADVQEYWAWLSAPTTATGIPVEHYLGLWALEPIEPMVYAPEILSGSQSDPVARRILLQMIRPDPIIPALSSLEFWKAMGGPEHPGDAELIEYDNVCRSFLRTDCQNSATPPDVAEVHELRAKALQDIQNFLEGSPP